MPYKQFARHGLAKSLARRYAARLLLDMELHAEAFIDEELTLQERDEARAELGRIARTLCPDIDD